MGRLSTTKEKWLKRKKRIRNGLNCGNYRPRLTVFRSAKHIYGQVVDDATGRTLVAASSVEKLVREQPKFGSKVDLAAFVGKLIAERALEKGVKQVVFDRNGFFYHGRVKALSEGAREAGLDF